MSTLAVSGEVDERAWWKEHPDPQVTRTQDRLVLWNYPVGGTKLADTHAAALRSFLSILALARDSTQTSNTVAISGHASASGEASRNDALARDRAENVAKHLRGLGFEKLEVTSAGSAQPADPAPTGQGLARNRRVDVTIYHERIEPPPRPVDPTTPAPPTTPGAAPPPSGAAMYFEGGFEIPLGEIDNGTLNAHFSAVGNAKVKVSRGDPQYAAGLVLSNGSLSAEFQAKLREKLDVKLGIEPGKTGEPPTAKLSLEGEVWGFPVEVGFQSKLNFLLMEVTLGTLKVPDIELNGMTLSLEIEGKILVEWGASKVVLARLGISAGAAGAGAAALGSVVVVTVLVIGGTIYASERAKQQFAALVVDTAMRDGAASRVTYEALGADPGARAGLEQRRLELTKAGGEPSREGFENGQQVVEAYLGPLGDQRAAIIQAWTDKFAKNANYQDFDRIRTEILSHLDPYENEPRPLEPLIAALTA